jgi:hypothetical protein
MTKEQFFEAFKAKYKGGATLLWGSVLRINTPPTNDCQRPCCCPIEFVAQQQSWIDFQMGAQSIAENVLGMTPGDACDIMIAADYRTRTNGVDRNRMLAICGISQEAGLI